MAKEEGLELEGVVTQQNKEVFLVEVTQINAATKEQTKITVQAYLAGKIRQNNIRIVPGDRVKVVVSPYDVAKGRIVYRMKG